MKNYIKRSILVVGIIGISSVGIAASKSKVPISDLLENVHRVPDTPSALLYGNRTSRAPEYHLYITFSEEVNGLDEKDFLITNGSISAIEGNGRYYSATVTAASPGTVEIRIVVDAVVDIDGDNAANTESKTLKFECLSDFGDRWIIDDESEWNKATLIKSHLALTSGYAKPTAKNSQFSSIIKTFPTKKKAQSVTFQQSKAWDNWTDVGEIDPKGAKDAPVMISISDGNYYYLGMRRGVYNAWHSNNMIDWVLKGPVTSGREGRWVTSAEYKDGAFYIYSDHYNDHQPHLFIDNDLGDGVPGQLMGAAFPKKVKGIEGHGSDCSLIRSDEDGLFHLIYEDWTSIKIGSRFWMFADYHPAGEGIKLAIFASDSIYEEFDKVGEMHKGHPDPTVCFAEGQFYLLTQQDSDYTSPGPWVDGVEARAGVDIDGDGTIDQWTPWQVYWRA